MMKRSASLLLPAVLPFVGAAATIVTPCSQLSTFADYQQAQICSIGQFTAKNFTFEGPSGVENALTPSFVFPAPLESSGKVSLGISGNFQGIAAGGPTVYTVGYLIDPPPEILDGFEASLDFGGGSAADPGPGSVIALADPGVMVTFSICAGGLLGPLCPDFHTLMLTNLNPSGSVTFSKPTNIVDILQVIKLDPGASFFGTSADVTSVPEPASGGVFLAGLTTLIGVRKAVKSRVRRG